MQKPMLKMQLKDMLDGAYVIKEFIYALEENAMKDFLCYMGHIQNLVKTVPS